MSFTGMQLDQFDHKKGLDRGRPKWFEALWYVSKCVFFLSPLPWPTRFKCTLLRWFGAKIGGGVVIKPRVNIHFPWKLAVGDHSWIGEEVLIQNFEPCTIGNHCCISQRSFLCGGNHDYTDPYFKYRNGPVTIESGAWVGAQCFVAPGVTVGQNSVVVAGSIVTKNTPENMVCSGNPCQAIKPRIIG